MSKSAYIAIGIEAYNHEALEALPGAKVDAERIFQAFQNANIFESESSNSSLHYNLTRDDLRTIIAEAAYDKEIESLTIYFAGHGGSHTAGYFLYCTDSNPETSAFSAISLADIFTILSSSPMKHVNLIIDACNAGGLAQDLSAISKNPQIGSSAGVSISIVALSSRDESSYEETNGGLGTSAFLDVLNGTTDNYSNKEHLSLGDVAQAINVDHDSQTASFWSLNLTGAPRFCKNIYAANNREAEMFSLPELNDKTSSKMSPETTEVVWKTYIDIASNLNARKLHNTLEKVIKGSDTEADSASLLLGLFDSFLVRSKENNDAFSPIVCSCVFLMVMNTLDSQAIETAFIKRVMLDELEQVIKTLSLNMIGDDYFLLKRGGGYSDFFTLPQRISNIAAWALLSLHINDSLKEKNTELEGAVENILNNLTQNYSASYDLMSEEQAPAIAVISKFVRLIDRVDWADEYIGCLYSAFFFNRRKVAHVNLKDELVYDFMRHRLIDEDANYQKFCARPTEVLFSLMAHYQQSNNLEIIRYDFEELDDVNINAYVPESYSSFAEERIPNGNNIGFTIGFDIFTADDFNNFVNSFLHPPVLEALKSTTDQERLIAIVASLIYPNRLPWFLILPN